MFFQPWTDPDGPLLTAGEIFDLPEGCIIEVRWCGGNGPHRYELRRYRDRHGSDVPVAMSLNAYNPQGAPRSCEGRLVTASLWPGHPVHVLDEVRLVHRR